MRNRIHPATLPPPSSLLPAAELHDGDDVLIQTDPLRLERKTCCHVLGALVHDGVVDVALRGDKVRALTLPAGQLVEVVEHTPFPGGEAA